MTEDIETKEQLEFLKNKNYNIYQEYFYSKSSSALPIKYFLSKPAQSVKQFIII